MSDRFVSLLYFSVELFISMVYAGEANYSVSSSVKWKVPHSLLASEFFRCLQAQWRLLGMDWGTRQLVFTTVIDRWAQESGLQSYWCSACPRFAAWWANKLPPPWSSCCVVCLSMWVRVSVLVGHTCHPEQLNLHLHKHNWTFSVYRGMRVKMFVRLSSSWREIHLCRVLYILDTAQRRAESVI